MTAAVNDLAVARSSKALHNARAVGGELAERYLSIRGIALSGRWKNRDITDGERASIHDALAEIYRNLDTRKRDALALLIAHYGGAATIDEVVAQSADLRDWAKRLVADAMAGAAK
jgi:hypothetical protein